MNDITQPLPGHEPSLHTVEMVCDRLAALGAQVGPDTARDLIRAVLAAEAPRVDARLREALDTTLQTIRVAAQAAMGVLATTSPAESRSRPVPFRSPGASSPTRRPRRRAVRATTRKSSGARSSAGPGAADVLLHRFYDHGLAQASYLLGCELSGQAVVVDPNRDVSEYLETAAALRVRIAHVTETHIHADFVSGSRELAERTGAKLYLSNEGGRDWSYGYAADAGAVLLRDGDRFEAGSIQVQALHTPGHTPEHLTFLVTDGAAATEPIAALTGDFIFVGDVGRPDLLERAAQVAGTMEQSARMLFRSLQRFKAQPDYLQLWPGHGAGSACGR